MSSILQDQNHYQIAIGLLRDLESDDGQEQSVLRELGRAYIGTGDYAAAARAYDKALEKVELSNIKRTDIPDLINLYEGTAEAARESGNELRATILYSNLAEFFSSRGYREQAAQVRALAEKNAHASAARKAAGPTAAETEAAALKESAAEAQRAQHIVELMQWAQQHIVAHQLFAATEACHDVIRIDSENLQVHLILAEVYMRRGHTELANAKLTALVTLYAERKAYREAAETCRILSELHPGSLGPRNDRIAYLVKANMSAEAVEDLWSLHRQRKTTALPDESLARLQQIEQLSGVGPGLHQAYGEYYVQVQQPDTALPHFVTASEGYWARGSLAAMGRALQSAVEVAPNDPAIREKFAEYLMADGRLEDGIQEFSWAADLLRKQGRRAESIEPLIRVAQLWEALDQVAKCIETYDLLLRLAPENAMVRQHFVNFSLARGRTALAARTLRALTEFFIEKGNIQQAVASLTQLISLRPGDSWAYITLAELLISQGGKGQAAKVYERYLQLQPNDGDVQKRLRDLNQSA